MIKKFAGESTLHGLRYVVLSQTRIRRLVWLLLLLGTALTYLFMVQQSILKYFSNPVSTEFMEIVPEDGALKFPAVTICNLNRFVKSKINLEESNPDFNRLGLNLSVCEMISEAKAGLTCGQALLCVVEDFGPAIVQTCNKTTQRALINVLNSTQEPKLNPEEFLKTYGHDFSAMFMHYCRFGRKEPCSPNDFLPTLTEHSMCYTFNSGRNGSKVVYTRYPGNSGGLSIILDVQANENIISEFSRGLRVVLHEQGTLINLDNGFNVFPGSHILVSMTAKKHIRLPAPYRSACVQRTLPGIANYTKDGCFKQCRANWTSEMCKCRETGTPVPQSLPVCTLQHEFCFDESLSKFNLRECSCGLPCQTIEYVSEVSYSQFPDLAVSRILDFQFGYNKSLDYQRRNLVFIQVGFRHLGYEVSEEIPSYRLNNLLGDIGGNMGLFLGCSILTLFEFIDLAWSLLENRMNRVKGQSGQQEENNS